jgi:hypothetical protein
MNPPTSSTSTALKRPHHKKELPANANPGISIPDCVGNDASRPSAVVNSTTSDPLTPSPPGSVTGSSAIQSTPISNKVSGSNPYTSMHYERDDQMRMLGAEMVGKFIGPMPVAGFLEAFLPPHGTTALSDGQTQLLEAAANEKVEVQMYDPLVRLQLTFWSSFTHTVTSRSRRSKHPVPTSNSLTHICTPTQIVVS